LLSHDQRDRIDIVLVSPRNPLNIGAVARAMANFGFSRLSVAAPYLPHWREARSAVGAPDVLERATESPTLPEAVAQCTFVAGTGTLTYRRPEQPVVALPALPALLARQLVRGGRAALVFGPEKHGLTREDLSWCHVLVEIPTDPQQPSMNLGQAVAVCLYELGRNSTLHERQPEAATQEPDAGRERTRADSAHLDVLGELLEKVMLAANYSPRSMQAANRHDVRLLLRRLAPSSLDTRRMLGLFRRILRRIQQADPDRVQPDTAGLDAARHGRARLDEARPDAEPVDETPSD